MPVFETVRVVPEPVIRHERWCPTNEAESTGDEGVQEALDFIDSVFAFPAARAGLIDPIEWAPIRKATRKVYNFERQEAPGLKSKVVEELRQGLPMNLVAEVFVCFA